jgi:transcriptional regulator with XRE-family HTH domain
MPANQPGRKHSHENASALAERSLSVHHQGMAPTTYSDVLARNIRAARARADLGQESVAARMRALGFDGWVRQTVGSTEKPTRRVTAEEVFALSLVLKTSVRDLMAPEATDEAVTLPSGAVLAWQWAKAVVTLRGGLGSGMQWKGDAPVFPDPPRRIRLPEHTMKLASDRDEWMARAVAAAGPWPGDTGSPADDLARAAEFVDNGDG